MDVVPRFCGQLSSLTAHHPESHINQANRGLTPTARKTRGVLIGQLPGKAKVLPKDIHISISVRVLSNCLEHHLVKDRDDLGEEAVEECCPHRQ